MNRTVVLGLMLATGIFFSAACGSEEVETVPLLSGGILSGTWNRACAPTDAGDGESGSLIIIRDSATFSLDFWIGDTVCAAVPASITFDGAFSYSLINAATLANGQDVTRYLFTDTAATITPNTTAGADALAGDYGVVSWTVGTAVDVLNIDETGAARTPTADEKGILAINDSLTPNELFFGVEEDEGGTVDAAGYPDTLETTSWTR